MTSLKNLFAVCIAISALGLTIAAHAGAFEAPKALVPNCFTQVIVTQPTPDVLLRRGQSTCASVQQYIGQLATQQSDPTYPTINSDVCGDTPNFFCCATINASGRIDQIFCKLLPTNP